MRISIPDSVKEYLDEEIYGELMRMIKPLTPLADHLRSRVRMYTLDHVDRDRLKAFITDTVVEFQVLEKTSGDGENYRPKFD